MIVYDLACDCGTTFEGWFADRVDFARQEAEGLLVCPACGGGKVRKILSPVRAIGVRGGEAAATQVAVPAAPEEQGGAVLKALQDYVRNNFEDVGTGLAEECLKVRYGLAAERNLRGIATPAEEEVLAGEGIKLVKIPLPAKPKGN